MKRLAQTLIPTVALAILVLLPLSTAFAQDTFVPLTSLPGLQDFQQQSNLPNFFNQLYRILIGVAAVAAVLQIMRAGFKFMVDKASVSGNKEAKDIIYNAIFGILLVLSPVIVFGIINPDILRLNLDVSQLQPRVTRTAGPDQIVDPASGNFTGPNQILWTSATDRQTAIRRCQAMGGVIDFQCSAPNRTNARSVSASQQCNEGETSLNVCTAGQGAPMNPQECNARYQNFTRISSERAETCRYNDGVAVVPNGCCGADVASGFTCCAVPKEASTYLIAYTFTRPATQGRAACYVSAVERLTNRPDCLRVLDVINQNVRNGTLAGSEPVQNFSLQRSCELGPVNYQVTPPANLPRCP